jgi:thiamine biosynthesis lipoprotein
MLVLILGCKPIVRPEFKSIRGEIFGTTYTITSDQPEIRKNSIDSLLRVIDFDLSTYKKESYLSSINQAAANDTIRNWTLHFQKNILEAINIYHRSSGAFDVSVMPLVNYWGFGYTPKKAVTITDSLKVDSIMSFVGLDKWTINTDENYLVKNDYRQQLDFSALAKGYAVDQVSLYLLNHKSMNHMVEIGGEVVVRGKNAKEKDWTIAINYPSTESSLTDFIEALSLSEKAIATSGNYRNFYEVDGRKYGHTINPHTGYPFQDELLGVTVVADNCMFADALATTCMAMGYLQASKFITSINNVEALFLIGTEKGEIEEKMTDGFIQYLPR